MLSGISDCQQNVQRKETQLRVKRQHLRGWGSMSGGRDHHGGHRERQILQGKNERE